MTDDAAPDDMPTYAEASADLSELNPYHAPHEWQGDGGPMHVDGHLAADCPDLEE